MESNARVCAALKGVGPPFRGAAIPKGPPFSAISSSDNLRLGIRLGLGIGLGLGSVVWLWQYQERFPATTMNNGFQNGGPFGMEDPNPLSCKLSYIVNSVRDKF